MEKSEILNLIRNKLELEGEGDYCLVETINYDTKTEATIFLKGEPITDIIIKKSHHITVNINVKFNTDYLKDDIEIQRWQYFTKKEKSNVKFSINKKGWYIKINTNSPTQAPYATIDYIRDILDLVFGIIFGKIFEYYKEETPENSNELVNLHTKITAILEESKNEEELENKKVELQQPKIIYKRKDGKIILPKEYEDAIFRYLIETHEEEELCRYTTMSSLIRIIENKKNSVCSIVCMNDKSECYYAEKYISKKNIDIATLSPNQIKELNKYFIMSCTPIKDFDRLTMWRMYADDAKGVCIKMKIDEKIINNQNSDENAINNQDPAKKTEFYLAKVSYGDENGNHKELDCIKKLEKQLNILLQRKSIWYHFFKPYDYKDENEVRLLCKCEDIEKYKWITVNSILCPVVEFNIEESEESKNKFPLIIESVLLGPKCPEKEINAKQLQYRINNQSIINSKQITVGISKIDHYR